MDRPGPYVLIGIDEQGRPIDVGLFDNEAAMRRHAARNTRVGCRYSVWTPAMNGTIEVPSVRGLSWEKSAFD